MKRSLSILSVVLVVALLGIWGCPKKTEVSSSPEGAAAEAAKQAPSQQPAMSGEPRSALPSAEPSESERSGISVGLQPVYFDFDRALIRDDQKSVMSANAGWMKAHPKAKIRIEGNCDERGTREYNQALGQRRAAAAKKYLTALGVPAGRISLISYGKEKPVCTESTESCWQKNRKDDFVVTAQ